MLKYLFVFFQYIIPQRLLSRCVAMFANAENSLIRMPFINLFIKIFKVDMSEALEDNPKSYATFNAFFTRELKPDSRPLCLETDAIASPADGTISQVGDIDFGNLFQAKGKEFGLTELLGGDEYLSQSFMGGKFATIYLSPKDYHRVHMPYEGQLQTMIHIPGQLFSVNNSTAELVPGLFARNERVVAIFDTNTGPMAIVLVGAMIVASIETVWAGQITPVKKEVRTTQYPNTNSGVKLAKGEEMGRFKLGSTAIVLFGPDSVEWIDHLKNGTKIKMGEELGKLINA